MGEATTTSQLTIPLAVLKKTILLKENKGGARGSNRAKCIAEVSLIQLIKEYCDQFKVQELLAFIFDQLMAPHYDFYNVKLRTPETRLLHFLTWWETTRNSELVLRRDPNDPESYTTTKITIRYEHRTLHLRTALGQPKPVTRIWFTLILPIDAKMTYEELAIVIHEQLKDDKPKCNIIYQKQSVPHNITTFSRFEVEADSRFTQDPRFAVVNGPRGIQPLSAESTNARRTCGLQLTIDGIPRAVTMKMPGITWQSAQHGLLRKAAAHAAEMRATAAQEALNQEDASQEAARQAAALAAADRAAADQEEAAQADARQAVALAAAERAAADQEEAAARRATAEQEKADQATTVLAAAGRAAADQEEGPFTMVPTNPKRERAAATTPGNSPPRTRKSTTTAQQRKFWGDNSDEETDEDTPMSGSDDEANGDIVEKITTTATDAGKRAEWVAKPLQAQRNAEKQKCKATNHERLDARTGSRRGNQRVFSVLPRARNPDRKGGHFQTAIPDRRQEIPQQQAVQGPDAADQLSDADQYY